MASLRLENLTKDYGKTRALESLNLEVQDGEFLVMLGPSGAGKTTILKLVAGIEAPSRGNVYISDKLMNAVEANKRNVAMAFESYALYPHFNVAQNLAFPLRAPGQKFSNDDINKRVRSVAETLNIHMLLDRLPQNLSNGQKQRVAVGRALVRDPHVLLLDEPISHLDAKLRHRMRQEFKALESVIQATTIYVTHDYLEAMSLGDRLVVLNKGHIQQIGKPNELFAKPANIFVANILGHPQINLLPGQLKRENGQLNFVSGDGALSVCIPAALRSVVEKSVIENVTLGIRPLHVHVAQNQQNETYTGKVYVYERLGTKGVLSVMIGQNKLDVLTPIEDDYIIDDAVTVHFDANHLMLFDAATEKNLLVS